MQFKYGVSWLWYVVIFIGINSQWDIYYCNKYKFCFETETSPLLLNNQKINKYWSSGDVSIWNYNFQKQKIISKLLRISFFLVKRIHFTQANLAHAMVDKLGDVINSDSWVPITEQFKFMNYDPKVWSPRK